MILNSYAILDAFVALLRLGLGVAVVWLAAEAWGAWGRQGTSLDARTALEERSHLLYLLAGVLLALNVLSWPLFYLLLQSYVSEWPGVMCIYGVTQIGSGSLNSSRFLPPLLMSLQAGKPALVFLSGSWLVLHIVNRRTRTAPLTGRILVIMLAAGLLAAGDASAELTYLAIPKKEAFLSSGCCTAFFDGEGGPARFVPRSLLGSGSDWLFTAYYAVNAVLVLALVGCARACARGLPTAWLGPLAAAALIGLAVDAAFLVEVAAPRLLHQPGHHCAYDLVGQAPRSLAAVALALGGGLFVGWGCVAGWLGDSPESRTYLPGTVGTLFRLAAFACVFSVVALSVELAVA